MSFEEYLIDHTSFDWQRLLAEWARLLPFETTVWLMNRYGDLFLVYEDGSVHMLQIDGGSVQKLASSRDEFARKLDEGDNANQWLMIPLIDDLVDSGKVLKRDQCYGFIQPPILGGAYTVENTCVLSIVERFSFNSYLHEQLKDLPDGTPVELVPVNGLRKQPGTRPTHGVKRKRKTGP
jgi:hypothetical protein